MKYYGVVHGIHTYDESSMRSFVTESLHNDTELFLRGASQWIEFPSEFEADDSFSIIELNIVPDTGPLTYSN